MSSENFSASLATSRHTRPEDKTKAAPAVDAPAAQPATKQNKGAPAQKSPAQKS